MRRLIPIPIVLAAILLAACSPGSGPSKTTESEPAAIAESSAPPSPQDGDQAEAEADLEASTGDETDVVEAEPDPAEFDAVQAGGLEAEDRGVEAEEEDGDELAAVAPEGEAADGSTARRELVTASVLRTVAESYRFRWSIEMGASPELPEGIALGGDGAVDASNDAFSMTIDFSPIIEAIGSGLDGSEGEDLEEFAALFGDSLEIIAVGGAIYLKWGLFAGLLGVETPWVSFSEAELGSDVVGSVTGFEQTASPEDFLQLMQDLADLSEGMPDEISGVATTRYSGVLDVMAAIDEYAEDEAAYDSLLSFADGALDALQFMPVTIWVDEQGRVRRFEMRMDLSSVEGAEGVSDVLYTFELFDFGEAAQIVAPSAELVTDMTDLFGGLFDSAITGIGGDFFADSDLDVLREECAAGEFESCDRLYFESPFDSEDEAFGETCGNRVEPDEVFSCTELAVA